MSTATATDETAVGTSREKPLGGRFVGATANYLDERNFVPLRRDQLFRAAASAVRVHGT